MVSRTCQYCSKTFQTYKAWLRKGSAGKYCSMSCASRANPTPSHKVEKNCMECGVEYLVKRYAAEQSKFCSRQCQRVYFGKTHRAENATNWRGGSTVRPWNSKVWARAVKGRDLVCVDCGAESLLQAHHLKSYAEYSELRFDVSNGITLCVECHAKRHVELSAFILSKKKVVA